MPDRVLNTFSWLSSEPRTGPGVELGTNAGDEDVAVESLADPRERHDVAGVDRADALALAPPAHLIESRILPRGIGPGLCFGFIERDVLQVPGVRAGHGGQIAL